MSTAKAELLHRIPTPIPGFHGHQTDDRNWTNKQTSKQNFKITCFLFYLYYTLTFQWLPWTHFLKSFLYRIWQRIPDNKFWFYHSVVCFFTDNKLELIDTCSPLPAQECGPQGRGHTGCISLHCPFQIISQSLRLPVVLYNALRYPDEPLVTFTLHTSPQAEISET